MRLRKTLVIAFATLAAEGCGDGIAPLLHDDVDRARADWVANRPPNYTYEVKSISMIGPSIRRITVRNHVATETVNAETGVIAAGGMTIEDIWTQILTEREKNRLHSATFDGRGIPIKSDMGLWELDSGRSFTIRSFIPF